MRKTVLLTPMILAVLAATPAFAGHAKPGVWKLTSTSKMEGTDARTSSGEYCRTAAEATADSPPKVGRNCTQTNVKWNGKGVTGQLVCKPPVAATGNFTFTFNNDASYTGHSTLDGSGPGGGPFKMAVQYTAVWERADCGAVKPL